LEVSLAFERWGNDLAACHKYPLDLSSWFGMEKFGGLGGIGAIVRVQKLIETRYQYRREGERTQVRGTQWTQEGEKRDGLVAQHTN